MDAVTDAARLGFDAGKLSEIDAWMQTYVDDGKFPGSSLLVARNGEVAHLSMAGRRSISRNLPFERDTIVRIYSMTKPVVSLALMMLEERGMVSLDDPIDRYLPEFSEPRALVSGATDLSQTEPTRAPTVRELLTHTSGLTYSFNGGPLGEHYAENRMDFDPRSGPLQARVKLVAEAPLAFEPGSKWLYSVGIDIVGRLVEVLCGTSLDRFLEQEIFAPLNMVDTGFTIDDGRLDRFADCYAFTEKDPLYLFDKADASQFHDSEVVCLSGGGGLVSTLADYFRFAEMIRLGGTLDGAQLVRSETMGRMRTNQLTGDIASYGLASFLETPMQGVGFGIGGSVLLEPSDDALPGSVGDYSWGGMASTFFWTDPVFDLTVIFFTQLIPSSTYPNRVELKALVHEALAA